MLNLLQVLPIYSHILHFLIFICIVLSISIAKHVKLIYRFCYYNWSLSGTRFQLFSNPHLYLLEFLNSSIYLIEIT